MWTPRSNSSGAFFDPHMGLGADGMVRSVMVRGCLLFLDAGSAA